MQVHYSKQSTIQNKSTIFCEFQKTTNSYAKKFIQVRSACFCRTYLLDDTGSHDANQKMSTVSNDFPRHLPYKLTLILGWTDAGCSRTLRTQHRWATHTATVERKWMPGAHHSHINCWLRVTFWHLLFRKKPMKILQERSGQRLSPEHVTLQ